MTGGMEIIQIIILALVAGFIVLRLRSILGQRPDDQPAPRPAPEDRGKQQTGSRSEVDVTLGGPLLMGLQEESTIKGLSGTDKAVLRRIFKPVGGNDLKRFLDGAKRAYEQTLKGFWSGDIGEMEPYLDKEIAAQFKTAISERNARGETAENRLVEISDVRIDDVSLMGPRAEVTVCFSSEIVAVLKDKAGRLIEGDMTDTINVIDLWTFGRNLKDKNPNWTLIATQAG
jgi:predicted lipid-binding transport protein (Tim44 family)